MSIQLIAKLLSLSVYTPDVLLDQLKENVLLSTHNPFVGNPSAQTDEDLYGKQLSNLIGFHNLSEITTKLLRVLALCPEYRMPLNILYNWYSICSHDLLSLEENGFVRLTPNHVTIQPYVFSTSFRAILSTTFNTLFVIFSFFKIIEIDTMHMYQNLPYF